ncbi:hypothetical protein BJF93_03595 [Xaviernesmea oryzae]|uniref:non-specific protein-tyrosine kinase n=1 Tax=Xaviernesmea oryzae TaxID=464029 RepID=A0A1Q9AV46_9HYPH|nr:hypothetical protein BJF93_03595 [Xaviernesmea oryzae]
MSEFLPSSTETAIDFSQIRAIIRRQWKIVAIAGFVALVLGAVFAFTATPRYTASATLIIDANNQQISNQILSNGNQNMLMGLKDDDATILSEVEILKSERIAKVVVDKLDLLNDPDFNGENDSALKKGIAAAKAYVRSLVKPGNQEELTLDVQKQNAADLLLNNLNASRVGRTLLLGVDYTSTSPELSAKIANAVVDAYLDDQFTSKLESTRRAGDWLLSRINDLREQSLQSDLAVQKFRADKGLIASGGELVSDQQLTQINSKLIEAQNETAGAQAKYREIQAIVDGHEVNAAVRATLDSDVINKLQQEYLDASRREAEISNRYGENHYQAVRLRDQMKEYERVMFEELGRIAQTYKSNYEIALARQRALEQQVTTATSKSALANDDLVQLRELDRTASAYKTLYETYLQRFQESTQRESFPVTEARVVNRADVPQLASYPKKPIIMILALVLGCGLGAMVGAVREVGERFFRTGEQVRETLDVEFLGQIPRVEDEPLRQSRDEPTARNAIINHSSIDRFAIDKPFSSFTETIRAAKIAVDFMAKGQGGKIVGIVSVLPGEGKSTVAVNFAQYLAKQGARTLIIDADLRNPGATRAIGRHAQNGIFEVLRENAPFRDVVLTDPETSLNFLPAVSKHRIPFSAELLSSESMDELLTHLSKVYDYIILDLPPLGPVVDARAISSKIGCFVMVIEWGQTARRVVRTAMQSNPEVMRKCAGVVLNKVDLRKQGLYMHQDDGFYQNSRYNTYYTDDK